MRRKVLLGMTFDWPNPALDDITRCMGKDSQHFVLKTVDQASIVLRLT